MPAAGPTAAVITRGLTRRFGEETAVADLDLEVPQGVIYGFIGPSGSGKTTTIRLLTGALAPTAGEAEVLGASPMSFSAAQRACLGYMPQLSVLYPALSLQENLIFVASLYGLGLGRRERLRQVLEFVELGDHRRKRLRDTSGGMQRRLALAAALVHEPELLFLDEPTAGVDPVLRRKFWDHFESLRNEGRTLFVTTQYVGEAAYCDLVGILSEGRLLAVDTPDGLRRLAVGGDAVDLAAATRLDDEVLEDLRRLPSVQRVERLGVAGNAVRVVVNETDTAIPRLQEWFESRSVRLESVRQFAPPFDDVFVTLVERKRAEAGT